MAGITLESDFNFTPITQLAKVFPSLNGRFLSLVGKRSREVLKMKYLSGQEITLRAFPTDSKGRPTIVSDVNRKKDTVKIYSYPVNLFEKGRRLRNGQREAGKFIITKKLKQDVQVNLDKYINDFENRVLEPELDKRGLS